MRPRIVQYTCAPSRMFGLAPSGAGPPRGGRREQLFHAIEHVAARCADPDRHRHELGGKKQAELGYLLHRVAERPHTGPLVVVGRHFLPQAVPGHVDAAHDRQIDRRRHQHEPEIVRNIRPEEVHRTPARAHRQHERQGDACDDAADEDERPPPTPARARVVGQPPEERIRNRVEQAVDEQRQADQPRGDTEEDVEHLEAQVGVEPVAPHVVKGAEPVGQLLTDRHAVLGSGPVLLGGGWRRTGFLGWERHGGMGQPRG